MAALLRRRTEHRRSAAAARWAGLLRGRCHAARVPLLSEPASRCVDAIRSSRLRLRDAAGRGEASGWCVCRSRARRDDGHSEGAARRVGDASVLDRARAGSDGCAGPGGVARAERHRRVRAAHRLRQRGQPGAGADRDPGERDRRARCARGERRSNRATVPRREPGPRSPRAERRGSPSPSAGYDCCTCSVRACLGGMSGQACRFRGSPKSESIRPRCCSPSARQF